MSSAENAKNIEETLKKFNHETDDFVKANKGNILCVMAYAVTYEYQPYLASYQRYFNQEVILKYDAKSIYAHNFDLPHFIAVYIIMKKEKASYDPESTQKECIELITKFWNYNSHVLPGLAANFYDGENFEKTVELRFENLEPLDIVDFFKKS